MLIMNNPDEVLFDGIDEVHSHYERGESYGLDTSHLRTARQLRHYLQPCWRGAITIRRLANGKPGADLVLYGESCLYH